MEAVLQITAILAVLIGTFFSLTGVLGYLRLPDVYTRLHAAGKVGIFGAVLLLVASLAWTPLSLGRGLVLIALLFITGPGVSHVIAATAYRLGLPLRSPDGEPVRDDLAAVQKKAEAAGDTG